ncbi:MAG: GNAT family N-acetyltransferase [Myxococcales bacterium]|nr:GNAT family N-acetyltransferase [Myxococcales bacterium]
MPIRFLRPGEEPALRAFIAPRNRPGAELCLHLTDDPAELEADLAVDAPLPERCLVDAAPDDTLHGALVYDIGGDARSRAWLIGPWSAPADAGPLLDAALAALPPTVRRVDNYLEEDHPARAAHLARGFEPDRCVHVLRADAAAPRAPVPVPAAVTLTEHQPEWRDAVTALHADAFPGTHTSIDDIVARGPARDRLIIAHAAGEPLGYIHLNRSADLPEGLVQYIAVKPAARGRGIGRALLAAGLDWLFGPAAAPVAFLTVDADNRRALGVYHAAGFAPYRSGRVLTRA